MHALMGQPFGGGGALLLRIFRAMASYPPVSGI
jgi:hypothetical protein